MSPPAVGVRECSHEPFDETRLCCLSSRARKEVMPYMDDSHPALSYLSGTSSEVSSG